MFKIDFYRLKFQFVQLEFPNLIFQNSSTDQQGVSMVPQTKTLQEYKILLPNSLTVYN